MDPDRIAHIREQIQNLVRNGDRQYIGQYLEMEGLTEDEWSNTVRQYETSQMQDRAANPEPVEIRPNPIAAGLAKFGQGASMGWSDELSGAASAVGAMVPGGRSPGEAYVQGRDQARAYQDASSERLGGVGTALDLAGSVAGGVASAPLAVGGRMLNAGRLAGALRAGTPSALRTTGAMAGIGALDAAGRSEDQGMGLARDAAMGGALGVAGGAAGNLLMRGAQGLGAAGRYIGNRLSDEGTSRLGRARALRAVNNAIEEQGQSLDEVARSADTLFDDAGVIAPVVGPTEALGDIGTALAVTSASTNRSAAERAARTAGRELSGVGDEIGLIGQALEEATGVPVRQNAAGQILDMVTAAKDRATAAYANFFDEAVAPVRLPTDRVRETFQKLTQTSEGSEAPYKALARLARSAARRPDAPSNLPFSDDASEAAFQRFQNWVQTASGRDVHNFRKLIDGEIQEAIRRGDNSLVRSWSGIRDDYLNLADEMFPNYGTIRADAGNDFGLETAYNFGVDFAGAGKLNIDDLGIYREVVLNGTDEQKRMFAMGALADVADVIRRRGNVRGTSNPAATLQRSREKIERLASVFPSDESFNRFLRQLDISFEVGARNTRTLGGSPTFRNEQMGSQVTDALSRGVEGIYNPLFAMANVVAKGVRTSDNPVRREAMRGVSDMMFDPRYQGREGVRDLINLLRQNQITDTFAREGRANAQRGAGLAGAAIFGGGNQR